MKMQAILVSIYSALCGNSAQGFGLLAAEREVTTTIENTTVASAIFSGILDWILKMVMTLIYTICKWAMNIIDFFQVLCYKLIGIKFTGGDVDIFDVSSPFLRFLLSEPVLNAFTWVLIASIVLLIGFTIVAIVRAEYKTAANGEDNAGAKSRIYKRVIKSVGAMITFPVVLIACIVMVNAILASVMQAFNVNPNATVGSNIFIASAYNSNNYRNYAISDARIPILIDFEDPEMHTLAQASSYSSEEYEEIYKAWEQTGKGIYTQFALGSFSRFSDSIYYKNNIIHNSSNYSGFEKFVCTPEQYQVMADFIDYAVTNNMTFYIKAYDDENVDWRYVSESVYDEDKKTFTIKYTNSTGKIGSGEEYSIVYQADDFNFETPMQAAIETINQILSIGDYDEYEFKMLERVDDEKNLVEWKTYKVNAKLSETFESNPTALDQLLLYEYYRRHQDHTFEDYTINDLSTTGADLKVMNLHNTRYSPSLKQYVEYHNDYVCEINGSYYKLVKTEEIVNGVLTTVYRFDENILNGLVYYSGGGVVNQYLPSYEDPLNPTNEELIDVVDIPVINGGVSVKIPTDEWGQASLYDNLRANFNRGDNKYNQVYTPQVEGADLDAGKRIYVDNLEDICVTGNWTEKIYNDLQVIYKDININTLINTDQWLSAFNEMYNAQSYITTDANDTSTTTFNTTLIHPLGLIQSELFLGNVEEGEYFNSYADFLYSSSYNDTVIKGLFISLLGEDNYHQAYKQYQVFMDIFNCMMSSVLDEIAFYEFFDIVDETNESIQLYTYKAYLSSVMMSTDMGNFLYDIANTIMLSNNVLDFILQKELDNNGEISGFTISDYNDLLDSKDTARDMILYSLNGCVITDNEDINKFLALQVKEMLNLNNVAETDVATYFDNMLTIATDNLESIYGDGEDDIAVPQKAIINQAIIEYNQANDSEYVVFGEDGQIESNEAYICAISQLVTNYNKTNELLNTFETVNEYWFNQQYELEQEYDFYKSFNAYMTTGFARDWAMGAPSALNKSDALNNGREMQRNFSKFYPYNGFFGDSIDSVFFTRINELTLKGTLDYYDLLFNYSNEEQREQKAYEMIKSYNFSDYVIFTTDNDIKDTFEAILDSTNYAEFLAQTHEKTCFDVIKELSENYFEPKIQEHLNEIKVYRWFSIPRYAMGLIGLSNNYFKIYSNLKEFLSIIEILKGTENVDLPTFSYSSAKTLIGQTQQLEDKIEELSQKAKEHTNKDYWRDIIGAEVYDEVNAELNIENGFLFERCANCVDNEGNRFSTEQQMAALRTLWYQLRLIACDGDLASFEHLSKDEKIARGLIREYVNYQLKLDALNAYNVYYAVSAYSSEVLNNTLEINVNNRKYIANINMSSAKFVEYILGYDKMVEYGYTPVYIENTYQGILSSTSVLSNGSYIVNDDTWAHLKQFLNKFGQACVDLSNKSTLSRLDENKIDNFVLELYKRYSPNDIDTEIVLSTQLGNFLIDNLSIDAVKSIINSTANDKQALKDVLVGRLSDINGGGVNAFREAICDLLNYVGLSKDVVAQANGVDTSSEGFNGFTLTQYKRAALNVLYNYEAYAEDSAFDNQQRYLMLLNLVCSDWKANTNDHSFINNLIKWKTDYNGESNTYYENLQISLEKDVYTLGVLMRLCGLENRSESELVGLKFTVDLTSQVKSEENGDVFVICTYDANSDKYYPFLMANNTYNDIVKNDDYFDYLVSNSLSRAFTTYYGSTINDDGAKVGQWYPVVAKGVITDKGYPTAIKEVDGEIVFYRDDIRIVNTSKLGITTYFSESTMKVARGGIISMAVNAITKAITGKTLVETATSLIPRIALESDLHFAYGTQRNDIANVAAGRMLVDYNFSASNGVAMKYLFSVEKLNVIILVLGTIFLFKAIWSMVWGLITRIMEITALSIVSPAVFSTIAFTNETKNKKGEYHDESWIYEGWFGAMREKILSVLGFTIGLNIFFILVPIINNFQLFSSADAFQTLFFGRIMNVNVLNYLVQVLLLICAITCIQSAPSLINSFAGVKMTLDQMGDRTLKSVQNIDDAVREYTSGRFIVNAKNKAIGLAQAAIPGYAVGAELLEKYRSTKTRIQANAAERNERDALTGGYERTSRMARDAALSRVKSDKKALKLAHKADINAYAASHGVSKLKATFALRNDASYLAGKSSLKSRTKTINKTYKSYIKNDLKNDRKQYMINNDLTQRGVNQASRNARNAIVASQSAERARRQARRDGYREAAFGGGGKKKKK